MRYLSQKSVSSNRVSDGELLPVVFAPVLEYLRSMILAELQTGYDIFLRQAKALDEACQAQLQQSTSIISAKFEEMARELEGKLNQ